MNKPTLLTCIVKPATTRDPEASVSFLRRMAGGMSFLLAWTLSLSPLANAFAPKERPGLGTDIQSAERPGIVTPNRHTFTPQAFPYAKAVAYRASHPVRLAHAPSDEFDSLLQDVAILKRRVLASEVVSWKAEVKTGTPTTARAAQLHVLLGEYELAHNEQPSIARWHFRQAQALSDNASYAYGLAAYDSAMAVYYTGAYRAAANAFQPLACRLTARRGYDIRQAARWLRHAVACAGYHDQRSKMGVPEPPRLDPLCGAAALATALKKMGHPYDRNAVLSAVHVTGEGSSFDDVIDGAAKLGVEVDPVSADDTGLKALPKPLISFIEHDHFIAITAADASGVTYLCSDCGPWPGGAVHLNWKQWHALDGGLYGVVVEPGSVWSRRLAYLPLPGSRQTYSGKTQLAYVDPSETGQQAGDLMPSLHNIAFACEKQPDPGRNELSILHSAMYAEPISHLCNIGMLDTPASSSNLYSRLLLPIIPPSVLRLCVAGSGPKVRACLPAAFRSSSNTMPGCTRAYF